LPNRSKHCAFLDEKWFYISSRRRKMRILPPHPLTENASDAHVAKPKCRSRRFPVKVMYQGIVARPSPAHNFNGRIMLKRVSKPAKTKKTSYNTRFDDSYHITHLLKRNEWRYTCTIDTTTTVQEAIDEIQHIYGLDDCVAEKLCFSYKSHFLSNSGEWKKKVNRITLEDEGESENLIGNKSKTDKNGRISRLTIEDLILQVKIPMDTEIEKDGTCDSTFMLNSVHETGEAIRSSMHWVPLEEPIILFMDNAGGHGTDVAKQQYVRVLMNEYNILVEWQIPNSPETNLLDLGFWCTHQAVVERLHKLKRMDTEALSRSVFDAFELVDEKKIERIYKRWEYVLDLIIKGEGTNDLVEMNRGLTKSLCDLPNVKTKY
jgi:hypothetical protein